MTPELQAAAGRVAAAVVDSERANDAYTEAYTADLRTLLAALDPAEQPIDRIPTKAGLDYLTIRHEQHPRTVRDFRGVRPEPNGEPA